MKNDKEGLKNDIDVLNHSFNLTDYDFNKSKPLDSPTLFSNLQVLFNTKNFNLINL